MRSRMRSLALLAVAGALGAGAPAAAAATTSTTGSVDAGAVRWKAQAFSVPAAATITVTLDWDAATANLNMWLYAPDGTAVAAGTSTTAKPERLTYQATTAGTWKVGVKAVTGAATYTLTIDQGAPRDPAVAPVYAHTLGGPGHAEMYPSGLDVDAAGNVYIADTGNDQVAAYAPDGTQLWRVGDRGARSLGRFENPRDVAHLDGRLYVADTGYNRVQVLDAATGNTISAWPNRFTSIIGISAGRAAAGAPIILAADDARNAITLHNLDGTLRRTIAPPVGKADGQLNAPRDAATDAAGNIYVADYANDRMVKFGPSGAWLMNWGSKGAGPGQFGRPYGVAFAGATIYVADSNNERVQAFTTGGTYLREYGSAGRGPGLFEQLRRVAVGGPDGDVYGADLWGLGVERFSNAGALEHTYGDTPPPDGGFNEPSGIAVDVKTFVADTVNQRIARFDTATGTFEADFGLRGWGVSELDGFNWPRDVAINATTNTVWVADTKNNRITEFERSGVPTGRAFGKRGSGPTDLNWPYAVDSYGADLVVADTFNDRVQLRSRDTGAPVWTTTALGFPRDVTVRDGTVYVTATNQNQVVTLDAATGAVLARFGSLHRPMGVAVDADGGIWVADTGWNRLVELAPDGSFAQVVGKAGEAHGQFQNPTHVEISGGRLYVVDEWNDRVEVFDLG